MLLPLETTFASSLATAMHLHTLQKWTMQNQQPNKPAENSFEAAFQRLEAILEMLNSGHVSLEEALKLYEEADKLIIQCVHSHAVGAGPGNP